MSDFKHLKLYIFLALAGSCVPLLAVPDVSETVGTRLDECVESVISGQRILKEKCDALTWQYKVWPRAPVQGATSVNSNYSLTAFNSNPGEWTLEEGKGSELKISRGWGSELLSVSRSQVVEWSDFQPLPEDRSWRIKSITIEQGDWIGEIVFDLKGNGIWDQSNYPFDPNVNIPVEVYEAGPWFVIKPRSKKYANWGKLSIGESPVVVGSIHEGHIDYIWGYQLAHQEPFQ